MWKQLLSKVSKKAFKEQTSRCVGGHSYSSQASGASTLKSNGNGGIRTLSGNQGICRVSKLP